MAITQFTTTPLSTEPTNFSTRMDTRIVEQQTFVAEANAMALEMNLYALAGPGAALAPSGFKNKIIGGDFSINPWQRGTSFVSPANLQITADRWAYYKTGGGTHTITKAIDSPTAVQAGAFSQHCIGLAVTTAQTVFGTNDFFLLGQRIEGLNAASFGFGQAGSRNVTLSFWVKGAKLGIHCTSLRNGAGNRTYVAEYTINAINTWEFKAITIPVDTAGTWLYDNGAGLDVCFTLAVGTSSHVTGGTWLSAGGTTTANQVNEMDVVGNNFKIALVQLEAGSSPTAFETRSVGQELALCQRYYEEPLAYTRHFGSASSFEGCVVNYAVTKRALPTISIKTVLNSANVSSVSGADHVTTSGSSIAVQSTAAAITNYAATLAVSSEL